jgi:hypothetical protein
VTGEQLFELKSSSITPGSKFGARVAISDGIALVASPDDIRAPSAAHLFDTATGQELFRLNLPGLGAVDISENTVIAIASPGGPGVAHLFDAHTGQELPDLTGTGPADELFGIAAAINGDLTIIGAPSTYFPAATDAGASYVFDVTRTTVPEPGCMGLACSTVVLMSAGRRRRPSTWLM